MKKDTITLAGFKGWETAVDFGDYAETHLLLAGTKPEDSLVAIDKLLQILQKDYHGQPLIIASVKIFTSESQDFIEELNRRFKSVLFTQVTQKPLGDSKVALWINGFSGSISIGKGSSRCVKITTPEYVRYSWGGLNLPSHDVFNGTRQLLINLKEELEREGLTVLQSLHRSWFFIDSIYANYNQFVTARKAWFEANGLTAQTHFIASTGIEGGHASGAPIQMDALAFDCKSADVVHLQAQDKLNPTIEYGVTFERGTRIAFSRSEHIYISGTASINHKGEVLYPEDAGSQTVRALENIKALLATANAAIDEVVQAIVYIRDSDAYSEVRRSLESVIPNLPCTYTQAAVCRREWLVEIECIVIRPCGSDNEKNN